MVNRGAAPATAARIWIMAMAGPQQVVAVDITTRSGLDISPGGRQAISIAMDWAAGGMRTKRLRLVVSVVGGASASNCWLDQASLERYESAGFQHQPLGGSIETGPISQQNAPWQAWLPGA